MNKLRFRIIKKIAQTQAPQPEAPQPILGPPPGIPSDLFSHLAEGYNGATVPLLTNIANQLHIALHYASQGKANFQKIIENNLDLSGTAPDEKNIAGVAEDFFHTFLNNKNSFNGKKVEASQIHNWADGLTSSTAFNSLSQIKPTSVLATKLQGNLKTTIQNYINQIKQSNPITA